MWVHPIYFNNYLISFSCNWLSSSNFWTLCSNSRLHCSACRDHTSCHKQMLWYQLIRTKKNMIQQANSSCINNSNFSQNQLKFWNGNTISNNRRKAIRECPILFQIHDNSNLPPPSLLPPIFTFSLPLTTCAHCTPLFREKNNWNLQTYLIKLEGNFHLS